MISEAKAYNLSGVLLANIRAIDKFGLRLLPPTTVINTIEFDGDVLKDLPEYFDGHFATYGEMLKKLHLVILYHPEITHWKLTIVSEPLCIIHIQYVAESKKYVVFSESELGREDIADLETATQEMLAHV